MDPDMEEKARLVEKYIISCYTEPDLSKILTVVVIPAVPPGENFLSVIWRIEVKIQLKNGEVKKRNLILKELPFNEDNKKAAITNNTFTREIETYELVLRKMDEIMTQFNCDFERPWGNLIMHNNYRSLLLEDLQPLGYEPADKIEGLTLQEAEVVFKSLGRFHAASKAALYHDRIKLSALKPRLASRNPKYIEDYIVRPFRFMSQSIDESWGPQWQGIAAKLDKPTEKIVNKMMDVGDINETRFNTIIHGDLWTNNIMFQRHRSGEAKLVKFVDFQLSFYSTVAWDITYLSFTSLSYDLRKQHLNHLLQIYIKNLQNDLRKYNFPEDKIPSFEYLVDEMKRIRFFGLVTILLYVAVILTGITGVKEDANILLNPSAPASQMPSIYQSEIFRDTVGEDILELLNEGVME